jgi:hypothetical protein
MLMSRIRLVFICPPENLLVISALMLHIKVRMWSELVFDPVESEHPYIRIAHKLLPE